MGLNLEPSSWLQEMEEAAEMRKNIAGVGQGVDVEHQNGRMQERAAAALASAQMVMQTCKMPLLMPGVRSFLHSYTRAKAGAQWRKNMLRGR